MSELSAFAARLKNLTDPAAINRIASKASMAGKKSALEAAARDLGADRRFSGMRRSSALTAGYDSTGSVIDLKFRGPWRLAEEGRRGTKPIFPRRRRAVLTPHGPRARSTSTPSRGHNTYSDAVRDAKREVPRAAVEQFRAEIRKVVRG